MNMCLILISYRDSELFGSTNTKGLCIVIKREKNYLLSFCDVSLTVHLSIILAVDQHNAHILVLS